MSIIAQKLGRTVYYMLKRKEAFNPDKFYGDKKIENKDSGGEQLAYVALRRLHERKLFKSPLSRLAHNWSVYGGTFEKWKLYAALTACHSFYSGCRDFVTFE